jgi:hypothetical protein
MKESKLAAALLYREGEGEEEKSLRAVKEVVREEL